MLGACPGWANGSAPSISKVGEPCMCHLAASPSSEMTLCDTETPAGHPGQPSAGPLGQAHWGSPARPERSAAHPAPAVWLPGQVPVEPLQRRPDPRPLMPASRHDVPADRLGGTAQRLTQRRGSLVPGPAPQKMDTADADTDFGMVAEVDQGALRPGLAAAPASALASLAYRCLGLSAHGGSRLPAASVGAHDRHRFRRGPD
jgi:hypothetical protein